MASWQIQVGIYNELSEILYHEVQGSLFAIDCDEGIVNYDFATGTWKLQRAMCELPIFNMHNPVAFDSKHKMIYVWNHYSIINFSIHPNTSYKINYDYTNSFEVNPKSNGFMINDEFHIFQSYGGSTHNTQSHIKYHKAAKSPTIVKDDTMEVKDQNIRKFGIVRLKNANKMMVFGGYDESGNATDQVCEYDAMDRKWRKLGVTLPGPLYNMGCATAVNDQYVLIFGGKKPGTGFFNAYASAQTDDILIYSVRHQFFRKSSTKCPTKFKCQAIAVNDKMRDETCVFGFVRDTWQLKEIDDAIYPPRYLIKLIHKFYLNEYIHLFSGWDHWRMDVFDIL